MSSELVAVHIHISHTFSGRVHYGEEPWGGRWLSLSQLCRRFATRVMVTRLSIKCHCEMYLTPSLESVLQGLINVRLMVMSPSTMKYLPDHYLLCPCLSNDTSTRDMSYIVYRRPHNSQHVWADQEDASPEVPFTLIAVPKLAVNPPRGALGSVTTEATL